MNARVLMLAPAKHRALELLLPWYVGGSLDPDEALEFEAHLEGCADCREEVRWQERLQAMDAVPAGATGADGGWAALRAHIDRNDARSKAPLPGHRRGHRAPAAANRRAVPWWPWVFAAQFAVMAAFAAFIVLQPFGTATYRTLGPPAAVSTANVLVVFRPQATEAEIRRILRSGDARLVGGPTVTDAYLLNVPPDRIAGALERLRGDPAVERVESLEAGPNP